MKITPCDCLHQEFLTISLASTSDWWQLKLPLVRLFGDRWHLTCEILWGVNILSKFQPPSSSDLWFMIFWRLGGKGWLTDSLNEWMNLLITKLWVRYSHWTRLFLKVSTSGGVNYSRSTIPGQWLTKIQHSQPYKDDSTSYTAKPL